MPVDRGQMMALMGPAVAAEYMEANQEALSGRQPVTRTHRVGDIGRTLHRVVLGRVVMGEVKSNPLPAEPSARSLAEILLFRVLKECST